MCIHYQGSLDVIVLLQANKRPEQTKERQEDADGRAMEDIEEKNRQAEQEPKQTDGLLYCLDFLSRRKSMMGQQLCKAAASGDAAKVCTLLREHLMELERERQQRARVGLLEEEELRRSTSRPQMGMRSKQCSFLRHAVTSTFRIRMVVLRCNLLSARGTPESPRSYGTKGRRRRSLAAAWSSTDSSQSPSSTGAQARQ